LIAGYVNFVDKLLGRFRSSSREISPSDDATRLGTELQPPPPIPPLAPTPYPHSEPASLVVAVVLGIFPIIDSLRHFIKDGAQGFPTDFTITLIILLSVLFYLVRLSSEHSRLKTAEEALRARAYWANSEISKLQNELTVSQQNVAIYSTAAAQAQRDAELKADTIRQDFRERSSFVNSKFLSLAETRFDLVHQLALYQARERALSLKQLSEQQKRTIVEALRERREKLHDQRLNSLTAMCNIISSIFTELKRFEVCGNIKFLVWDTMGEPENTLQSQYMTIARSENTRSERRKLHIRVGGDFIPYKIAENQFLRDLLHAPGSKSDLVAECLYVADVKTLLAKRREKNLKWPNEESPQFYRSVLIVPIWHELKSSFSGKELVTVLYDRPFKTIQLRDSHGTKVACYGFLTIDSLKPDAFDQYDIELLKEAALLGFTNLFEVFSIQFEDEGS
jgi:hypothetical protein